MHGIQRIAYEDNRFLFEFLNDSWVVMWVAGSHDLVFDGVFVRIDVIHHKRREALLQVTNLSCQAKSM